MTIPKHRQVSMQIHTCTISHQITAKNFVVQSLALPFFFLLEIIFVQIPSSPLLLLLLLLFIKIIDTTY